MKIHPHASVQHPPGQLMRLLGDRWILGVIVLLSLEFGTEAVFAGWSAAYALAVVPGAPPEVVIALYWGGICLGRALAPIALARTTKRRMVVAGAGLAAVAALALTGASGVWTLSASIFIVGLALGPLAPAIVSLAGDRHPKQMGTVIGLLLSAGQVGSTVLPWCAGRAAVASGFRVAMLVPAIAITVVAAGTVIERILVYFAVKK
jgi:fucose permease